MIPAQVWVGVPQTLSIGDNPIVDADGMSSQDGMIVAGDDLGTISDHTAMTYNGERFVQFAIGGGDVGKGLVKEVPVGVGGQHDAWGEAAFENPDFVVDGNRQPASFLTAWFRQPEQILQDGPDATGVKCRAGRRNETENAAHGNGGS